MAAEQIALPFWSTSRRRRRVTADGSNADLIGQRFYDGPITISVKGLNPANPKQVMVERDSDGKNWSVPAGLIRLIVGGRRKRRAA